MEQTRICFFPTKLEFDLIFEKHCLERKSIDRYLKKYYAFQYPFFPMNLNIYNSMADRIYALTFSFDKVIMEGKLFQRCTHLLYCSVLSLGSNVNTRRMSQPDMGSIFHLKKSMKYSGHRKLLCELSKLSKLNAFIL